MLSLKQIASTLADPGTHKVFIYPKSTRDASGTKSLVTHDWVSTAMILTMTNGNFEQAVDNDESIDAMSGRPSQDLYHRGTLIVLAGGPVSHNVVNYYMNRAVGKEKAPIRAQWAGSGREVKLQFIERSGEIIAELGMQKAAPLDHDYGAIQTFMDASGRLILLICGLNWQGTWAASLWLRYNCIREDSCNAILVQWKDLNHNGLVELAEVSKLKQFAF